MRKYNVDHCVTILKAMQSGIRGKALMDRFGIDSTSYYQIERGRKEPSGQVKSYMYPIFCLWQRGITDPEQMKRDILENPAWRKDADKLMTSYDIDRLSPVAPSLEEDLGIMLKRLGREPDLLKAICIHYLTTVEESTIRELLEET